MPVSTYAKLRASINGGPPQTGGLGVVHDVVVQLSPESTQGWKLEATVYQITAFPPGWTAPGAWTYDPVKNFFYYYANGSNGVNPPALTLPSTAQIAAGLWGKWKFRLLVNGGGGTLTDWSLALNLPDSTGIVDVAVSESGEFGGNLKWVAALQNNFRIFAAAIHGGVGGGVSLGSGSTTPVNASAPSAGSASTAPPYDHGHQVQTAAPSAIGTAIAAGSAATLARSDHIHSIPWATITSVFGAASSSLPMNGKKITGLGAPTPGSSDAATAAYAESLTVGLATGWRNVRGASLGNQSLSGALTEDGIVYQNSDRYLAKNQTSQPTNGIYVVNTAGAWTRAADLATNAQAEAGATVYVAEGTANHDTGWSLTTNAPIVLGSDNLVFEHTISVLSVGPNPNTAVLRGSGGEIYGDYFTNDAPSNVASTGLIRASGVAQALVAAQCVATPAHNIPVLAMDGSDGIAIGNLTDTTLVKFFVNQGFAIFGGTDPAFAVDVPDGFLFSGYPFVFFGKVIAPVIGQLPLTGTSNNAGQPLKVQAQTGQAQSGSNNNNNGGDLTLAGGDPGTGGSGTPGVQGPVDLKGGGKTATLDAAGLTIDARVLADYFSNDIAANIATTGILRASGAAATLIAAQSVAVPANNINVVSMDGADSIFIGDSANGNGVGVLPGPGKPFVVQFAATNAFAVDGGTSQVLSSWPFYFFGEVVAPQIGQGALSGTGTAAGQPFLLKSQPGQNQSGGANNNDGGSATLSGGDPGTGGSGAAGAQGPVFLIGGGKTVTLSAAALDVGTVKITSVVDPTAPQHAATKAYADAGDAARVPTTRTISTTLPLTGGGDLSADRTLAINATSAATPDYVVRRDGSGNAAIVGLTVSSVAIPSTLGFIWSQSPPSTGVIPYTQTFIGQSAHTGDSIDGKGFSFNVGGGGSLLNHPGDFTIDLGDASTSDNLAGKFSIYSGGGGEAGYLQPVTSTPILLLSATNQLNIKIAGTTIFSSDGTTTGISGAEVNFKPSSSSLLKLIDSGSKIAFFAAAGAGQQTVSGNRAAGGTALASALTALANYGLAVDTTTAGSDSQIVFLLDVTLNDAPTTQASGKNLSNAKIVGIYLKTPSGQVNFVTATISGNNVIVSPFTSLAAPASTDKSTYTVALIGAV